MFFQEGQFSCNQILLEQGAPENPLGMGGAENAASEIQKDGGHSQVSYFVKERENLFWLVSDFRYVSDL